jgi:hypothetical protein
MFYGLYSQNIGYFVMNFVKYLVVWISQNLAIPFWMVGHIHLTTNVYQDMYEILTSIGLNVIVAIGFFIDYKQQTNKNGKTTIKH